VAVVLVARRRNGGGGEETGHEFFLLPAACIHQVVSAKPQRLLVDTEGGIESRGQRQSG